MSEISPASIPVSAEFVELIAASNEFVAILAPAVSIIELPAAIVSRNVAPISITLIFNSAEEEDAFLFRLDFKATFSFASKVVFLIDASEVADAIAFIIVAVPPASATVAETASTFAFISPASSVSVEVDRC